MVSTFPLFQNDIQVQKILKENVKGRRRMRPFEYSVVNVDGEGIGQFEEPAGDDDWEDGGTTTILEFPVKKHHVEKGKVEVKCRAGVIINSNYPPVYESETIVNIPVTRGFSFFDSSSCCVVRLNSVMFGLVMKLCYFWRYCQY